MQPITDPPVLTPPPAWSLQLGAVGRGLVWVAVFFFLLAILGWALEAKGETYRKVGKFSFTAGVLALFGTFISLTTLFLNNRFEYEYVFSHSDLKNPPLYRFAGLWSGQEGSFLLWATCSALFAFACIRNMGVYRRWVTIVTSSFLAMIVAILAFESPFKLAMLDGKSFVPEDGAGLAPSLQNYWVAIHPPVIFLGFGSLTTLFALGFAALATRDYKSWLPIIRPLAILSMTLLGLGLCMGGFWAYETLGWGGFWMWDPVENVSFVPWCFGIALTHGLYVQAARGKWVFSNLLLAGLPFLVFVYGTFLTRSGFLSDASVHSFAEMDRSALKLLVGAMGLSVVSFGALWGYRLWQNRAEDTPKTEGLTRDRWIGYGIWASVLMGMATFVGMSVPLVQSLSGKKASTVPESLYHQVLPYFFIPLMVLMAAAPFLRWKKAEPKAFMGKVYNVVCISVGLTALMLFLAVVTGYQSMIDLKPTVTLLGKFKVNGMLWVTFLTALCNFTLVGNLWVAAQGLKGNKLGFGSFLSHVGISVLMCGLIVSRGFERKGDAMITGSTPATILNYRVKIAGMTKDEHDRDNKLLLEVDDQQGKKLFVARPGMYKTTMGDGQETTMVWPHIERGILQDTYISLGQPQPNRTGSVSLKVGESVSFEQQKFTYLGMETIGEFGQVGTKFVAKVKVSGHTKERVVRPAVVLQGAEGMGELPAELDSETAMVLEGMNAADKSISLRLDFSTPVYPVEIFHKPLTSLVFLGTALMTVAGLMGFRYRRTPQQFLEVDHSRSTEGSPDLPEGMSVAKGTTT